MRSSSGTRVGFALHKSRSYMKASNFRYGHIRFEAPRFAAVCSHHARTGRPPSPFPSFSDSRRRAASHTKIAVELRMFQFKTTDAGTVTLHHIAGQGDDFADSLCYAVWPFRGRPGKAGFVAVSMPSIERITSPPAAQFGRPFRSPNRPRCVKCKEEIPPGEVWIGREGRQHAKCPRPTFKDARPKDRGP